MWQLFDKAISMAWGHHLDPKKDFMSEVMDLLDSSPLDAAAADAKVSDDSKEADEAKVHSLASFKPDC